MKSHELLLERFKEIINGSPHGAIIILSEKTGGKSDIEYASNLSASNQLTVLRELIQLIEAKRGAS